MSHMQGHDRNWYSTGQVTVQHKGYHNDAKLFMNSTCLAAMRMHSMNSVALACTDGTTHSISIYTTCKHLPVYGAQQQARARLSELHIACWPGCCCLSALRPPPAGAAPDQLLYTYCWGAVSVESTARQGSTASSSSCLAG